MNYQLRTSLLCNKVIRANKTAVFYFLLVTQCLALVAFGKVKEPAANLTQQQQEGAAFLDFMSMPCPGESFAAINKVSRPNWAALSRGGTVPVTTNRAQLALAVGVLITNGYIAVEAQDGQQVKNIGRDIMSMARALGVSQSILSRGNNLIEFADHNEWDALRDELEATENEVKTTMVEQQDRSLITLTSSGAWLRGLQVASGIISDHYSEQSSALLYEPELARHLTSDLEMLPDKLRNDPFVIRVKDTLTIIAGLLEKEPHGLSKETLLTIQAKAGDAVVAIGLVPNASPTPSSSPMPMASVQNQKK